MRNRLISALLGCWLVALTAAAWGAEIPGAGGSLSLQGFSGVLNTPDARLTPEGWLDALYSNQKESEWRNRAHFQDNYLVSIGLFDFLEIGGRFTESRGVGRDLSANLKVSSWAFTRNYPLVPVVAAGAQDVGGGVSMLKSRYLVLSEDLWRLRLSGGYGFGGDRMKGGFAGGELRAWDWLYLLGEYDSRETNVGARVVLPQFWKVPVRFTATAKTSLDYRPGHFEVALGFSVPLDFRVRPDSASPGRDRGTAGEPATAALPASPALPANRPEESAAVAPAARPAWAPSGQLPTEQEREPLELLRERLVAAGMLNVGVAARGRTLVVEYENVVFNHNELDALGLVAGLACRAAAAPLDVLEVVVKKRNLPVLGFGAPLDALRPFLESADATRSGEFRVAAGRLGEQEGTPLVNRGWLTTSLMLAPGLTTFIGTENAPFDYLLSLKPELNTQLWTGALVHARWDIPLAWSENLEDGKPYRSSRHPSRLERLMLFQAFGPYPGLTLNLGAGMVVHDRYGTLNELRYSPGEGAHRFRVLQGWSAEEGGAGSSRTLLGSYRYYYAPLHLSLEGTGGRFWAEDQGFSFELKRFFADTAVSLYYKETKGTDRKRWQAVGLQLSFPLTPRRDMKPLAKLQLRGSDEWSYAQETTLKNNNVNSSRGRLNYLAPYPLALAPLAAPALDRSLFNRDRLSPAYVRQHLDRLREAWLAFAPEPR